MKKSGHKNILAMVIILIAIIILTIHRFNLDIVFTNAEKAREMITSFGFWGPLVLMLLLFLAVILFVFPSVILTVIGGYLYGPFFGTIYSVIGVLAGSIVVFSLSRKYGRSFVERHVHRKDLEHFDVFFKKRGLQAFFISRLIPLIPNDVVNLIAGLTKISRKDFIWITLLGYIPETVLYTMFGKQFFSGILDIKMVLLVLLVWLFFLIYIFRQQLRVLLIKEIRAFEKKLEREEHFLIKDLKEMVRYLRFS